MNIGNEYRNNQGLTLTEDDFAGLVYGRLRGFFISPRHTNKSGLLWHMRTQDPQIYASPVHLEVPWYDGAGKLKVRPDITILEPNQLSILHRYGRYGDGIPSKQFEFAGSAIIMELKFIREKVGITSRTVDAIKDDYNKIRDKLINQANSDTIRERLYCFFVVFNKTDNRCPEFNQYLAEHDGGQWYKYVYCSGKVTF